MFWTNFVPEESYQIKTVGESCCLWWPQHNPAETKGPQIIVWNYRVAFVPASGRLHWTTVGCEGDPFTGADLLPCTPCRFDRRTFSPLRRVAINGWVSKKTFAVIVDAINDGVRCRPCGLSRNITLQHCGILRRACLFMSNLPSFLWFSSLVRVTDNVSAISPSGSNSNGQRNKSFSQWMCRTCFHMKLFMIVRPVGGMTWTFTDMGNTRHPSFSTSCRSKTHRLKETRHEKPMCSVWIYIISSRTFSISLKTGCVSVWLSFWCLRVSPWLFCLSF